MAIANVVKKKLSPKNVRNYVDDWVVATKDDVYEYINMLRTLFTQLRMAGLQLMPSKGHFFQKQVDLLGVTLQE